MRQLGNQKNKRGFALPTVLIASIVMLTVLLVSVSSTEAIRTSISAQYYDQLAQAAGDAGAAYAQACLNASGGVPGWSDAKPLMPNTDCNGNPLVACTTSSVNPLCSVTRNGNVLSSFSIGSISAIDPSILVVGGGGGGAGAGSGGGAGAYVYSSGFSLHTGAYTVAVGSGGSGGPAPGDGTNGNNSSILDTSSNGLTALGGGGGNSHQDGNVAGSSGGSGGGGNITTAGNIPGGGDGLQGNNGGAGYVNSGWTGNDGGGGGAGGVGAAGGNAAGTGAGGIGLANSITGSSTYYAGGGAGGEINSTAVSNPTLGGLGGGGNANTDAAGSNAAANTGGGGGGGSYNGSYFIGGNGGSGIVVISYPTGLISATGGTITTSGNNTIHKFTSGGTFTVNTIAPKTIPNSGFVEVLRTSNNAVWRTYNQPAAQPIVVPDQCSGAAGSIYGWNNATVRYPAYIISDLTARALSIADSDQINPGPKYYRKDFSVTTAGTYTLTTASRDAVSWYLDGKSLLVFNRQSTTPYTTSFNLTPGCHTLTVKAVNTGIVTDASDFMGSLKLNGTSTPIVVTDASWRVSAGNLVQYSSPNYYVDPTSWTNAINVRTSIASDASWAASSGDSTSSFIASPSNNVGGAYPASQWTDFRDGHDVVVGSNTDVRVTVQCDDNCIVYMDGNSIISNAAWSADYSTTITIPTGTHHFGVSSYNGGVAANAGGFSFSAVRISDGAVLTHSDTSWLGANYWNSVDPNPYSYDNNFSPSPGMLNRGVNISPAFSTWTLSGGATYDSTTGQITLPTSSALASSPLIQIDKPKSLFDGADFYPTTSATNFSPAGGFYTQANYYAGDGTTPVNNSAGSTASGCAQSLPLNTWTTNVACSYPAAGNVVYLKIWFAGSTSWASPGIVIRNPVITIN
ncbi:MAG: hypothetical protein JWN26_688 [Candidatus Saccharibacteria bacterium]|nr:hypothetical protein [Candidatus Saccharibacteria bacterium]